LFLPAAKLQNASAAAALSMTNVFAIAIGLNFLVDGLKVPKAAKP
jgi:hypothetical protein